MQCAASSAQRAGYLPKRTTPCRQSAGPRRLVGGLSAGVSTRSSNLARKHEQSWIVASTGGGDGGAGGSFGGSGGSGGGGSGGGDGDGEGEPAPKPSRFVWKGWQDRVAADPQFVFKVMIEQVIGVTASVLGDMAGRPNWGLNELDFVFATLVVGSIVNFALMYLLAPTASAAAGTASQGLIAKLLSEQTLLNMGAPGGHMFQPGFSLGGRLINFVYKGAIFATIGMMSGLTGTTISNGLVALRKRMDPSYVGNDPPSIVGNASCWAMHMGVSSNLRYQMLNGLDMVLQPRIPSSVFRVFSAVIRGVNNMIGGVSFVMVARLTGVQKANEPAPVPVADPKAKKGKGRK